MNIIPQYYIPPLTRREPSHTTESQRNAIDELPLVVMGWHIFDAIGFHGFPATVFIDLLGGGLPGPGRTRLIVPGCPRHGDLPARRQEWKL